MIEDDHPTYMDHTNLSHDELQAQAAAMREALEGVWEVCSHDLWPKVGAALEGDAGTAVLGRLRKAEDDRDLLLSATRPFARMLDANDTLVEEAASFSHPIPDDNDDTLAVEELSLGHFRRARTALQTVQATPERAEVLEGALTTLARYADVRRGESGHVEVSKDYVLGRLTEGIPELVSRALSEKAPPSSSDEDPILQEDDALLARRIADYERTLNDISGLAPCANEDQAEHVLLHMLEVEIPYLAQSTLENYRESSPEQDEGGDGWDDDSWIPF